MSDPCDDLVFLFFTYPKDLPTPEKLSINGTIVIEDVTTHRLYVVGTRIPEASEDDWLQQGWTTQYINTNIRQILDGSGDYYNLISTSTETYTLCGKVLFDGSSIYLGTPYVGIPNAYEIRDLGCYPVTTTGNPCATTCLPYVPTTSDIIPPFSLFPPIDTSHIMIILNDAPISNNLNHGDLVTTSIPTYTTIIPQTTSTPTPTTTIICDFGCNKLKF